MSAFSADMELPILGVSDGDTIRTMVNLPCPLCHVSIRILGIDTPETNFLAKCKKEFEHGTDAKNFLIQYLNGKSVMFVKDVKWDKYGGRINGIVEVDGVNIADLLISKGYARPYTGKGQKSDWCSIK
jgi:micrococcal nuclease